MKLVSVAVYLMVANIICEVDVVESRVVLNQDGQYENLVVKIDQDVTNLTFLTKIEDLFKESSSYLYGKTNNAVFFKSIQIILPDNEATLPKEIEDQVKPLLDETLSNTASIEIGLSPGSKIATPYTVHLGECGAEGHHIFLPSNFVYSGNKGMKLVHEWAHYRWGVFDEYAVEGENGSPFYLTPDRKIAPNGCPSTLRGWVATKDFSTCSTSKDGLPDAHCLFYFDNHRSNGASSSASIMMGYGNAMHDHFCTKASKVPDPAPNNFFRLLPHNDKSNNVHNRRCSQKSTWEIMQQHSDFEKEKGISQYDNPIIEFLKRKGSESSNIVFLIYKNNIEKKIVQKIEQALECVKHYATLVSLDVRVGKHRELEDLEKELENITKSGDPKPSQIFIFTKMEKLCDCFLQYPSIKYVMPNINNKEEGQDSGNKFIVVPYDSDLSELAEFLSEKALGSVLQREKMPVTVHKKRVFNQTEIQSRFHLDSSCEKAVLLVIDPSYAGRSGRIGGTLMTPSGLDCFDRGDCKVLNQTVSMFVVAIESSALRDISGYWSYDVRRQTSSDPSNLVAVIKCRRATNSTNDLRIITSNQQKVFNGSSLNEKVMMRVLVQERRRPVLYANVSALIVSDLGQEKEVKLGDSGSGPDLVANDGIYSAEFFQFDRDGVYSFSYHVRATKAARSLVQIRRFTRDENGVERDLGGRPEFDLLVPHSPNHLILTKNQTRDLKAKYGEPKNVFRLSDFRASESEKKVRTELETEVVQEAERFSPSPTSLPVQDVTHKDHIAPGKVRDLRVVELSYRHSTVTLEWTSSGDDSYDGKAHRIDLRYSNDIIFYPARFFKHGIKVEEAALRRDTSLAPKPADEKHRITLSVPKGDAKYPEDLIFFYALVVFDEESHQSEVSNLATAFFKPEEYSEELQVLKHKSNYGIMVLVIFVVFVVIVAVLIFGLKTYQRRRLEHDYHVS